MGGAVGVGQAGCLWATVSNDAPVLARADVGAVGMGGLGSTRLLRLRDVVIMNDEPSKLAVVIKIARRTMEGGRPKTFCSSLGVKGLILLLGALGCIDDVGSGVR